jgi:hypothetical protein
MKYNRERWNLMRTWLCFWWNERWMVITPVARGLIESRRFFLRSYDINPLYFVQYLVYEVKSLGDHLSCDLIKLSSNQINPLFGCQNDSYMRVVFREICKKDYGLYYTSLINVWCYCLYTYCLSCFGCTWCAMHYLKISEAYFFVIYKYIFLVNLSDSRLINCCNKSNKLMRQWCQKNCI